MKTILEEGQLKQSLLVRGLKNFTTKRIKGARTAYLSVSGLGTICFCIGIEMP